MRKLSKYDSTTVRITCTWGETFTGACTWYSPEEGLDFLGVEEESLRIGDTMFFASQIRRIELLRREICVPVRDWPEAKEEIIRWFQERRQVPPETCRAQVLDCLGREQGLPQWYVAARKSRIIAGCGVIADELPRRKDLTPTLCALYVDEEFRNRGIGGFLLGAVCEDMAALGVDTLYLLADRAGLFEGCGWQFLSMVPGEDGAMLRLYAHRAGPEEQAGP